MPRVGKTGMSGTALQARTLAATALALVVAAAAPAAAEMGGDVTARVSASGGAVAKTRKTGTRRRDDNAPAQIFAARGFRNGGMPTVSVSPMAGKSSTKKSGQKVLVTGLAASKGGDSGGTPALGRRGGPTSGETQASRKTAKRTSSRTQSKSEIAPVKRANIAVSKSGDLGMGLISAKLADRLRRGAAAPEPAPEQFAAGAETGSGAAAGSAGRTPLRFDLTLPGIAPAAGSGASSGQAQVAQSGGSSGTGSGTSGGSNSGSSSGIGGQTVGSGVPGVKIDRKTPVLLTADKMAYDRNTGVVSAKGNVEISQGTRVLKADNVAYNQNTGVVTATGNVSITEPTGEVFFAERAVLTKEMREGVIEKIRVLLQDDARMAANGAVRVGGNMTVMRRAVFSPCALCPDDPTKAPLWQVRADRVVHDQTKRNIEYHSGTLEMFGIPVAYIPYFYHPDPTVKRRTGLLPPRFGSDTKLGRTAQIPVYLNIAPDLDATIAPIFLTKDVPVLAGEIRYRFVGGELGFQGSYTRPKRIDDSGDTRPNRVNRGHIDAFGRLDIDSIWRAGFDTSLATDRTYLRRYNLTPGNLFSKATAFGSEEVLVSRGYLEGFKGRNYASAESFYFQNQREGISQSGTPFIAPEINLSYISEPLPNGSRWSADLNFLNLHRTQGTDSRRASGVFGWEMPYIGRFGDVFRVRARLQTDAYWVNEVTQDNTSAAFRGFKGRVFPQASIDWRMPFVKDYGNVRHIIEPRASVIFGPNGPNNSAIPNEDSLAFEFDDTNLFNLNRFPGLDRVDGGRRIAYGLKNSFYGNAGGRSEIFVGQALRAKEDDAFRLGSGAETETSDIVGRVLINPSEYLNLLYRFRVNAESGSARRHEVFASGGPENLRLSATYLFAAAEAGSGAFGTREEVRGGVTYKFHKYWTVSASTIYDLAESEARRHAGGVKYEDECFILDLSVARSFTSGNDFGSSLEVGLQITFKQLGDVRASR